MTKIFEANYDDILSSNAIGISSNNEMIEKVARRYIMSNDDIINKKNFLRMKKEYYKITNINDYKMIQDRLYGDKTKSEILSFELTRILNKNLDDPEMLESISSIQSILSSYKGDITDSLYMDIADIIISLEISLGMKIGLFRELCVIFEQKLHEIVLMTIEEKNKTR